MIAKGHENGHGIVQQGAKFDIEVCVVKFGFKMASLAAAAIFGSVGRKQ